MCDTVAELGATLLSTEDNEDGVAAAAATWPELLPFLFACLQSGTAGPCKSALDIIGTLSASLGAMYHPQLASLHGMLGQCLRHPTLEVQVSSLLGTANYAGC